MDRYNGHASWAHWNVSLWINNDEGLYRLARDCVRTSPNKTDAAAEFIRAVGAEKTPDGARYTVRTVRAAIFDM